MNTLKKSHLQTEIEYLYENRLNLNGYMRTLVCFWYPWMMASIKKGDKFWKDKMSHNSIVFIGRAYNSLERQRKRNIERRRIQRILKSSSVFKKERTG